MFPSGGKGTDGAILFSKEVVKGVWAQVYLYSSLERLYFLFYKIKVKI